MTTRALFFLVFATTGCSQDINRCSSNEDCKDIAYPFCDVNGHYGDPGLCAVRPMNCPAEECGCTPATASCSNGTLLSCNSDGMSATSTTCALGCADAGDRCAELIPLYGVGDAISDGDIDAIITAGSTVASDTGIISDSGGVAIAVAHTSIAQTNGAPIQVFHAKSFSIADVTITGTSPVAFVASGMIVVTGRIEVGARGPADAPGAATAGPLVGRHLYGNGTGSIARTGGGGNGTVGPGAYGGDAAAGDVLVGGGHGGQQDALGGGGGGGGAVQLFSRDSISVSGGINVGGGGGRNGAGGGAGGTIVLEASTISVAGKLTANGGAGDACSEQNTTIDQMDGQYSTIATVPAHCVVSVSGTDHAVSAGAGATGTATATEGQSFPAAFQSSPVQAGDGGAAGRIVINTTTGSYSAAGAVVSGVFSGGVLSPH